MSGRAAVYPSFMQGTDCRRSFTYGTTLEVRAMAGILWTIIVILVVIWLIGLIAHIGGGLINLLLVIALIILIVNIITGRRPV